jgi:PAS domain S-box-containing protein
MPPTGTKQKSRTDEKVNILLVDDRPDKTAALEAVLSGLEQTIFTAKSGQEALRLLLEWDFAVVVLDVRMPVMSGLETAQYIRQRLLSRHTPIIFVTAEETRPEQLEQAYALGLVDFIASPIIPLVLKSKVATHVDLYLKRKALERDRDHLEQLVRERTSELEATNKQLQESEEGFRIRAEVLGSMSEGVSIADENGIIVYTNTAEDQMFGYEPGELIGKHVGVQNAYPPEENAQIVDSVFQTLKEKGVWTGEWNNRRKDGMPFITFARITKLEMPDKTYFVCVQEDITARKKAELALQQSERHFRELADAMPQIVWTARPNGYLDYYNKRWYEFTGFSEGNGGDDSWKPILHPDDVQLCLDTWYASVRSGEAYKIEYRFKDHRTGEYRWFLGRALPIRDEAGHVLKWFGTCTDIHDQKTLQAELEDRRKDDETLIEIGMILASELDLEKLVQKVTDAATRLTRAQFGAFFYNVLNEKGESYSLYTISGVPREMFSKFPMPRNTPVFAPTFGGQGVVRSDDITKDPRYGKRAPHHGMPKGHLPVRSYLAVPVVSRSKEVLGGLFFGHERTGIFGEREERIAVGIAAQTAIAMDNARLFGQLEKKVAERTAKLQETISELESFSYTVSHDLRAPLRTMQSYAQILKEEQGDALNSEGTDFLDRIINGSARMDALIQDVLIYSKISRAEIQLHSVDIEALIDAIIEQYPNLQTPKAEIAIERPLPKVIGHEASLTQCLSNLLGNAVKFVGKGTVPKIRIFSEPIGSDVRLCIEDNGIGIEPRHHDRIFGVFERLNAADIYEGTGIGLAIVRKAIERMGGQVGVESEVGKGSKFWIRLRKG